MTQNATIDLPRFGETICNLSGGNCMSTFIALAFCPPVFMYMPTSKGTISFQGGVPPPGINTTDGYISSIIFRVVNVGVAAISIKDSSRVLLADGKGSDILGSRSDAIFPLKLPPPAGPVVVAPGHEDPNKWYQDTNIEFVWAMPKGATAVSYVLNAEA